MPTLKLAFLPLVLSLTFAACLERQDTVKYEIGNMPKLDAALPSDADDPIGGMDADGVKRDGPPRMDACTPAIEVCNGLDDDCNGTVDDVTAEALTRIESCGSCNNVCQDRPNSAASCTDGKCGYTCVAGAIDIDNGATNGCECILVGAERDVAGDKPETSCDKIDNDCDGKTDEGFDQNTELKHCGGCNRLCSFPFALAACDKGQCKQTDCQPGFTDSDPTKPGCECQKTNGGVEICDGVDNNCNAMIDENVAPTISCKGMGVCAGTVAKCGPVVIGKDAANADIVVTTWSCPYSPMYQADGEDMSKGCDGIDNDCDGLVDEAFRIGSACVADTNDAGQKVFGECVKEGQLRCKADKTIAECGTKPSAPGAEICDGLDNDCDGKVDELVSASDRTTDDKLVVFTTGGKTVTMFAFEAARFDASAATSGVDGSRRPCSVKGKLPWSNVTKEEAQAACAATGAGWRLCTKDEWQDACNGKNNNVFPYGDVYDGVKCNGADFVRAANATTVGAGNATQCLSDQGDVTGTDEMFDFSGNVKEWVLSSAATANPLKYELRGGAYNNASFQESGPCVNGKCRNNQNCDASTPCPNEQVAPGLQCGASTPAPGPAGCANGVCPGGETCGPSKACPDIVVRLPSVGFRCCKEGVL